MGSPIFIHRTFLKGKLPKKAANLVKEWVLEHRAELEDDWVLAQNLEPLQKIPGADND